MITKKRILIFSSGGQDQMSISFQRAFQQLGHETEVFFEDRNNFYLYIAKLFARTALFNDKSPYYYQRFKEKNGLQYEQKILSFKPDMIFMFGFNSISGKLIKKITEEYKIPTAYFIICEPLIPNPFNSLYFDHLIYCSHLLFMCPFVIASMKIISKARARQLCFAGDESIYFDTKVERDIDVLIVGNFYSVSTSTMTKAFILDKLCEAGLNVHAAGVGLSKIIKDNHFPNLHRLVVEFDKMISNAEANILHNRAKIILATTHPSDKDALHPRVIEGALSGAFILGDSPISDHENFGDSVDTFSDINNLISKIKYYLQHENERAEKAVRARQYALEKHTFHIRAQEILNFIFGN